MGRLTLLQIHIIGAIVAIIVGVSLYFTVISGANEQIAKNQTEYQGIKDRADKLPTAEKNLAKAKADKAKAEADFAVYDRKYMPVINYGKSRLQFMRSQLWNFTGKNSWPNRLFAGVRGFMSREQARNGIRWSNPDVLQMGPFGPNPNSIDIAEAGHGLGESDKTLHYTYQMNVTAPSIQAILRHVNAWSSLGGYGVPVVQGLQIAGQSPELQATYTVTLTLMLKEDIPPTNPRIGTSGAGGGQGGFGGGMTSGGGMMMGMGPGGSAGMNQMMSGGMGGGK
jgi:hypothetical protein